MATFPLEEKGEAILITGGKYAGKHGWRWLGKGNPTKQVYVIVVLEVNNEVGTRILKGNVGLPERAGSPTDYVDAVLQQHSDIDQALNKACKMLAKCAVNGAHQDALLKMFLKKLNAAAGQQQSEGQKATWFSVDYDEHDENN